MNKLILLDILGFLHFTLKTRLPYKWDFYRLHIGGKARLITNNLSYFLVYSAFSYWFIKNAMKYLSNLAGNRLRKRDWILALMFAISTATQVAWPIFLFLTYFLTCSFYPWFTAIFVILLIRPSLAQWFLKCGSQIIFQKYASYEEYLHLGSEAENISGIARNSELQSFYLSDNTSYLPSGSVEVAINKTADLLPDHSSSKNETQVSSSKSADSVLSRSSEDAIQYSQFEQTNEQDGSYINSSSIIKTIDSSYNKTADSLPDHSSSENETQISSSKSTDSVLSRSSEDAIQYSQFEQTNEQDRSYINSSSIIKTIDSSYTKSDEQCERTMRFKISDEKYTNAVQGISSGKLTAHTIQRRVFNSFLDIKTAARDAVKVIKNLDEHSTLQSGSEILEDRKIFRQEKEREVDHNVSSKAIHAEKLHVEKKTLKEDYFKETRCKEIKEDLSRFEEDKSRISESYQNVLLKQSEDEQDMKNIVKASTEKQAKSTTKENTAGVIARKLKTVVDRRKQLGYCGHCGFYDNLPFRETVPYVRDPYHTRSGFIYGPIRRLLNLSEFLKVYGF